MKLMWAWLGAYALGFNLDVAFFIWALWALCGVLFGRPTGGVGA